MPILIEKYIEETLSVAIESLGLNPNAEVDEEMKMISELFHIGFLAAWETFTKPDHMSLDDYLKFKHETQIYLDKYFEE